jgi:cyclopropane fatty-acyl-phospholipid synthase-like methyltransferase
MNARFPRSANYEELVAGNLMGPHVLWLMESLCARTELATGMRVMDLGCGKAISSIFLAREFGVQVWATDLWIAATDNWKRIRQAGVEEQVFPIHAEARALPYPDEFFDAILSIDAYHYFGTDDLYLEKLARFLKPAGQLAIACPGLTRELRNDEIPEYLRDHYFNQQWHSFHSPAWWRWHWEKTGTVEVVCAEEMPEAPEIWKSSTQPDNPDAPVVLADAGRLLTFSRVVARKLVKS